MFYETHIFGQTPVQVKEVVVDEKQKIMDEIAALQAQIAAKKAGQPQPVAQAQTPVQLAEGKKNHRAVKAQPGRKYILLAKSLADWGKVPQQQKDLASILASEFAVGAEVEESEVFARVTARAAEYPSLMTSVQHPTYLLVYYRSYDKKDGRHAGFIRRNFLQVKG
jgi:hypothetical protein